MIYVKCIAIGLLTLLLGTLLFIVALVLDAPSMRATGGAVSFDLIRLFHSGYFLSVALASFFAGFYWTFRRASRR